MVNQAVESEFSKTLLRLRKKAGKSAYQIAQFSGINEAYLSRLEHGEKIHPSRNVVLAIAMALVSGNETISLADIDQLLLSADLAPLQWRNRLDLS